MKKTLISCLAVLAGWAAGTTAHAFPDSPVKLIVPYAAGGGTDGLARALAEGMGRELNQPVVVENKVGAGAIVGTQAAAVAPKDGLTMLMAVNGNMVIAPLVYNNLRFDPVKDFRIFTVAVEAPSVALVAPNVPVSNLREFEAYVKANQGRVFYGMLGQGNVLFIATKAMESMMGVQMTGVPYKGSAPALNAAMAGEVQMYVDLASTSIPFIKAGRLKALAVPNDKRLEALPDIPTFAEAGYPALHAVSWMGLAVPAGTPEQNVKILQSAARKAIGEPKFREVAKTLGLVVLPEMSDKETADYLAADRQRWGTLVKRFDIKVEQ